MKNKIEKELKRKIGNLLIKEFGIESLPSTCDNIKDLIPYLKREAKQEFKKKVEELEKKCKLVELWDGTELWVVEWQEINKIIRRFDNVKKKQKNV